MLIGLKYSGVDASAFFRMRMIKVFFHSIERSLDSKTTYIVSSTFPLMIGQHEQ